MVLNLWSYCEVNLVQMFVFHTSIEKYFNTLVSVYCDALPTVLEGCLCQTQQVIG